jgi:hypothetical protein
MAFERFEEMKHRSGKIGKAIITVSKVGVLNFNVGAMRQFDLYGYTHAIMFYDRDSNSVGIMLTKKADEKGAYKLIKRKTGGYGISAKKFLNFYGIDYTETKSCPLRYHEKLKMFVFQI